MGRYFVDHTPPMPLKHFTETFLIVVLGAVILFTGLLTASLPDLPNGALPWVILFVLSIVYPLSLHSMFQKRRADNFFRKLHWFPSIMLLVWLALQVSALTGVIALTYVAFYTWAWTLPAVIVGFILIVLFSLKVIRRRVPRLAFLALLLVPFAALAFVSERGGHFESEITAMLWDADIMHTSNTGGLVASWFDTGTGSEKNLEPSDDIAEEEWREQLRMQQRREERIEERIYGNKSSSSSVSSQSSVSSLKDEDTMLSGTGDELRNAGTMPGKLPSSGFGWSFIILTLVAAYSATLHRSVKKTA